MEPWFPVELVDGSVEVRMNDAGDHIPVARVFGPNAHRKARLISSAPALYFIMKDYVQAHEDGDLKTKLFKDIIEYIDNG